MSGAATPSDNGGTGLVLFVTGDAPRSRRARANLARALEDLGTTARPREIDLVEEPAESLRYGVFATPALLHLGEDGPEGVLYGDLSESAHLQRFLADALGSAHRT